ncbi:hypothetical protein, partial [Acinetobacter baumannii]|uniref:hypothetical protein n=1 Tax=Acinetobacter baumannii TaxID=470 RepID=UPI00289B1630
TVLRVILAAAFALAACDAGAHQGKPHAGGIQGSAAKGVKADYDIIHTRITTEGNVATFHVAVSGKAGKTYPTRTGKLGGSTVFSYV